MVGPNSHSNCPEDVCVAVCGDDGSKHFQDADRFTPRGGGGMDVRFQYPFHLPPMLCRGVALALRWVLRGLGLPDVYIDCIAG